MIGLFLSSILHNINTQKTNFSFNFPSFDRRALAKCARNQHTICRLFYNNIELTNQ